MLEAIGHLSAKVDGFLKSRLGDGELHFNTRTEHFNIHLTLPIMLSYIFFR